MKKTRGRPREKGEFFNQNFKNQFLLNVVSEQSSQNAVYVFLRSFKIEKKLNKDLYDLTIEEIKLVLKEMKVSSSRSIRTYVSIIKGYINNAIELKLTNNNPLAFFKIEMFEDLIQKRKYLSDNDLYQIIEKCVNIQDKVLLQLLFEGVWGKGKSELYNLKKEDIDEQKNKLILQDDNGNYRELNVSEKCIQLINQSFEENTYITPSGRKNSLPLSNYVIRSYSSGRIKVDQETILLRFKFLNQILNLEITPTIVRNSGMIKVAKDEYINGKIQINQVLDVIYERYTLKKITIKHEEKSYLVYDTFYRVLLTENLESIYGIDVAYLEPFILVDDNDKNMEMSEEAKRYNQGLFRDNIVINYEQTCAISEEDTLEVLQAAHIQPYINEKSHHMQNGILLRMDIHQLFDCYLLSIDQDYIIHVNDQIESQEYRKYHHRKIRVPKKIYLRPSKEALKKHFEKYLERSKFVNT